MSFRSGRLVVSDQHTAQKIGTDALLLARFASEGAAPKSILDIGCGCGIVGLSVAEVFAEAQLTMIDISAEAISDAVYNIVRNGLQQRATALCADVNRFQPPGGARYDLIVCNPPFFCETLQAPEPSRAMARSQQASGLAPENLWTAIDRLAAQSARVYIILPRTGLAPMGMAAVRHAFELSRLSLTPKRALAEYVRAGRGTT